MLKLNFIINDYYIASHLIRNYRPERFSSSTTAETKDNIVKFRNTARDIDPALYFFLDGRSWFGEYIVTTEGKGNGHIGKNIDTFYSKLFKTLEFTRIKEETIESMRKGETEWNTNYPITNKYLSDLGLNIDGEFKIWVSHPELRESHYMENNNIAWSYQEDWANYNTVYLWHEIIHSFFAKGSSTHALIELITDEEMRKQLNGTEYPPFIGHDHLKKTKEKLLPLWQEYLKEGRSDIRNFLVSIDNT